MFRGSQISFSWFSCAPLLSWSSWNMERWFLWGRGGGGGDGAEKSEKNPPSKVRTSNKPGPHCREASAIPAPLNSLLQIHHLKKDRTHSGSRVCLFCTKSRQWINVLTLFPDKSFVCRSLYHRLRLY